ncbi:MAG TPA: tRNA (adenosine(37)-N6)-threonylcarbamoyltransferase complex transferase subunit TsaD, partial [Clostridiales bacterium]|nr:tRNA (adenosine(37)-N6)-threonylcarbamoyltransferase complex transferase subunit TsaD [Clostridiales bacterium]
EMASRQHMLTITPVIEQGLRDAGVGYDDLDAIAVTYGPGLAGSLLVGVNAAKAVAFARDIPLVGINHLEGHIYANWLIPSNLEPGMAPPAEPEFPLLTLIVSGGHTELVLATDHGKYRMLGCTIDDAAGEAFDKIARAVGLGYPGGPLLDRASQGGRTDAIRLPRTDFPDSLDFSFSGLKTAALNQLQRLQQQAQRQNQSWQDIVPLCDFAASYQQAIVDVLVDHTFRALEKHGLSHLALAGGVAANSCLRRCMAERAAALGIRMTCPPPDLCTDNAAMIAAAGYFAFRSGRRDDLALNAFASLEL